MDIDINAILNTLKTGISGLAQNSLKDYLAQAEKDGQSILVSIKDNLQKWGNQLASGELTPDDLAFLIKGQEDLIKIAALTQAGITEIDLDKFKQGVINLIVTTLSKAVKIG